MKGPGIDDAELEGIIPKAVNGDEAARDSLLRHLWLYLLLEQIADWAWRRFKVDRGRLKASDEGDEDGGGDGGDEDGKVNDIQSVVYRAVRDKITTLKNKRNRSWRAVLRSFCYSVAKNHCRNVLDRDGRLKATYEAAVTHENSKGTRKGVRVFAPRPVAKSEEEAREQEREEEREKAVWEGRVARIDQTIWQVFDSLTPQQQEVTRLWAKGLAPKQIAAETGLHIKTTYPWLKKIQRSFVEEIEKTVGQLAAEGGRRVSVEQIMDGLLQRRAGGLRELIASALQKLERSDHAPPSGA